MKTKNLKLLIIALILAKSLSSCQVNKEDDDIDMSDIDFSNIENLYEQPLPVIKKAVQGKWKLQYTYKGYEGVTPILDPPVEYCNITTVDELDSYMHISENHLIMGNKIDGVIEDSPIRWVELENLGKINKTYLLGFNFCLDDCALCNGGGIMKVLGCARRYFVVMEVKNGNLAIWNGAINGETYYYTKQ